MPTLTSCLFEQNDFTGAASCNSIENLTTLFKKYGLEDIGVQLDTNPMTISARGCLKDENSDKYDQKIEVIMQISPDFKKAEKLNLSGGKVINNPRKNVFKAFDLSELLLNKSIAKSSNSEEEVC